MPNLDNKRILLGVTGGIAAYKSAELVRLLKKMGAEVKVVQTRASQSFITPLTFQALSGNTVHVDLLDTEAEAAMGHIELARWAELIIVAPATANFMAGLRAGLCKDLLSTLCLATRAPIALAPAMNQLMWSNPATQSNAETLRSRAIHIWGPGDGEQACGDTGRGRMLEPQEIAINAQQLFTEGPLKNKKVVITAGPTQEPIDPVRYISNHSSGKMGYALARAAAEAGAKTILISGPTAIASPSCADTIYVKTAKQMLQVSIEQGKDADIFISAAAVSDYRAQSTSKQKIKKGEQDTMSLSLTKNPDIVSSVANLTPKPYTVGFAAETTNVIEYAESKLRKKNLDLIIANDVSNTEIGFNSDYNEVTIIDKHNKKTAIDINTKEELARDIIKIITSQMENSSRVNL